MSKTSLKRVRREVGLPINREPLPAFAWPGGYPLYYLFRDGGVCCPTCANDNVDQIAWERVNSHGGWALAGVEANYEDDHLNCDHCGCRIESAYGEPTCKA